MSFLSNFLTTSVKTEPLSFLKNCFHQKGLKKSDYAQLEKILLELNSNAMPSETMDSIRSLFNEKFLSNTIQGFAIRKPFGYSGDFKIIDMIYTEHKSELPEYYGWDDFFHTQPAPIAVRNRKTYFKNLMADKLKNGPVRLLNVASGPARDLFEVYMNCADPAMLQTDCVELDPHAIEFAEKLCSKYNRQIRFHNKNILRFSSEEKFDIVWSAGLFDYFEDRIFILALKKFRNFLKPGGEIVIGNFSQNNPSKAYMELFGDWFLIHRSPEQLLSLAMNAGFKEEQISIKKEPLGVNLFMHIQC